jgi:serine/threonine-protein kinase
VFRGRFACCPRDGTQLAAAHEDPLVGEILGERYAIEELLGEGGMGRVYRAHHVRMSRRFAVKVLFGDLAGDPKVVARFSREAEAASRLHHPSVIGVVDFGETPDGLLYLAMDFADGPTLGQVIDEGGPVPSARARLIAEQIADGLEHAHKKGLVHRDLKPDNVVIEQGEHGDQARVLDFGIAILKDERDEQSSRLTTDGLVVGTPHYMAPEQAMNEPIDHRIDLFALGVMLYEMLAGKLPFDGGPAEVARAHITQVPPRVHRRNPAVTTDPLLEALAFRLMAKKPDDRPENAKDVAMCLRAIGNDRGAAARWLKVDDSQSAVGIRPATPPPAVSPAALAAAEHAREIYAQMDGRGTLPMEAPRADVYATTTHDVPRRRRGLYAALALLVIGGGTAAVFLASSGSSSPASDKHAAAPPDAAAVAMVTPDATAVVVAPADAAPAPVAAPPDAQVAIAHVDAGAPVADKRHPKHPVQVATAGSGSSAHAGSGSGSGSAIVKPAGSGSAAITTSGSGSASAAVTAPPAGQSLRASYESVGRALDALVQKRGEDVAEPLKRRYLAIPYVDAIRDPSLRPQVQQQLTQLARDIAAQK